ncbi:MAG: hydroxyacylglutathione hydrolase [Rhodospirillaceae bacterium]|jgi:hydroxyacylglutathione hydrolase|nr:hydroxyacylglutathione hydrolase [Rhodospirillaceae bacterium]MBT5434147.1 hydroxyacylglutathione hydrolase [Rhodospirillaceae bacterium]MBT6202453.1 hydroxyacylglutathione hydrolase [Rhodospirillaceae bacterium]MBT6512888.1 hydroxyacylglutathione hydrolase [Rhodospirillaceae bacterium]MBT7611940.1 hydroxyacylglutathione hydrolase [Rhodospirillaceae bacterium]
MSRLEIHQIPVLSDNYVYLAHCPETDATAVVDPAVTGPVLDAAKAKGWTITHILNTHHHDDHTGGNLEIKEVTGCTIVGPRADRSRIPGIDVEVDEGDSYTLGNAQARVYFVPGHTRGHIAFWFEDSDALFCGDTMFALGCGRLFEGTPAQMWSSLSTFMTLPGETRVYCAHEYTQANGRFALSVEPDNGALVRRMAEIDEKRANDIPTVPSTIAEELATNPFLRPESPLLQKTVGLLGADPVAVFAETRARKDSF